MKGKVCVIAGASGTLGAAAAEAFAQAGCSLHLGWHRGRERCEALAAALGARAVRLSSDEDCLAALTACLGQGGRLDVLVNCAGLNIEGPAAGLSGEDFRRVLAVNLGFAFDLTQAALRWMLPQGGGRVVHLSSAAARLGGRGQINYAASKAGLERLVKGFALEVGRKGVAVNAVAPGLIESPMAARVAGRHEDEIKSRVAAGRLGRPEEVAAAALFLAGPGASYINGAVLAVDGGLW
jgi:3-oxoacyl-[acyl-carrier protein] reductase